jgi:hypothetical protein
MGPGDQGRADQAGQLRERGEARAIFVMPGLVPGIHVFLFAAKKGVDGRAKPGHDDRILAVGSGAIDNPLILRCFATSGR